ncbi:putative entry exclusion protein TrbK-alt [Brevundimonas sp.]|jgi:conjugative transfer region protein TrbK|uniref:putative entry exclusion protein TrbK-alt n=1 Tax=Brevundimonas sp. TaxID=1871086 RepID=UPI002E0F0FFD|nr:putative entry exclusion protein TrbK-alt [Brevundimonas sp.]
MRRRITTQEELDRPKVRRVVAILIVGTIVAGVAAWLAGVDDREGVWEGGASVAARPVDPLRAELLRCNGLGQAALEDVGCRNAWAENRRRFFGSPNRQPPSVNESRAVPLPLPGPATETPR